MNAEQLLKRAVFEGFVDELHKIAESTGAHIPEATKLASLSDEEIDELFKEGGVFSGIGARLGQYGKNIGAYAQRARDVLTGGDFARQMKSLGSSSPMTTSSTAGSLASTPGPMRLRANQAAMDLHDKASLNPASWGLPTQPARRPVVAANPLDPRNFGLQAHEINQPAPFGRVFHNPAQVPELQQQRTGPALRRAFAGG
jgi:hypothetical protein